jgi:hypothetical protein
MSEQELWQILAESDTSNDLIICANFPPTGRPDAGFADLVATAAPGASFWHTVAPLISPADRIDGYDYVQPWLDDLKASGRTVLAVFGFCVGSVYAAALAEGIAQWQPKPRVILFDVEVPNVFGLNQEIQEVMEGLAGILPDEDIADARRLAVEAIEENKDDVVEYAAHLARLYRQTAGPGFAEFGLDEQSADQMFAMLESFMAWMSVASTIDTSRVWPECTAISSNDPGTLLRRVDPSSIVKDEIRFDITHGDLLRSDVVAKTVIELLEG